MGTQNANDSIYVNLQIDCEATQSSIKDKDLGERAILGIGEIMAETNMKATFCVIPGDIEASAPIYTQLMKQGHEIGLHLHPKELGYHEFLGVYSFDEQVELLNVATDRFCQKMGFQPRNFTPGYCSANDHTFLALANTQFKHGMVSFPTRNIPEIACVWGESPLDIHYPHHYNRMLRGNLDFVDIPPTIDPESRMWGGKHPQDLRVELVDAKNHWYTVNKNVLRQVNAGDKIPVKHIKILTHNIFEYSNPADFRRETLFGIIKAVKNICEQNSLELIPATNEEIAMTFREKSPIPSTQSELLLDTRGRK